ncbi:MAG TPA: PilZ domain-containing protein [Allosphingosinicella sp.]|jgi:hypothetical protein
MSFYQPLAFPQADNERRHDRHPVELPSRVRELGSPGTSALVRDVSIGGCRLNGTDVPKDAEIWVTLGATPMRARVVWVKSGEAGCEFYAPLSRADLRNLTLQRTA